MRVRVFVYVCVCVCVCVCACVCDIQIIHDQCVFVTMQVLYLDDEGRPITPAHLDNPDENHIDTRHLHSVSAAFVFV